MSIDETRTHQLGLTMYPYRVKTYFEILASHFLVEMYTAPWIHGIKPLHPFTTWLEKYFKE